MYPNLSVLYIGSSYSVLCFFGVSLSDFFSIVFFFLQSHTILLVQPTKRPEGRTYADYESVNECMEGEVCMFNYAVHGLFLK